MTSTFRVGTARAAKGTHARGAIPVGPDAAGRMGEIPVLVCRGEADGVERADARDKVRLRYHPEIVETGCALGGHAVVGTEGHFGGNASHSARHGNSQNPWHAAASPAIPIA